MYQTALADKVAVVTGAGRGIGRAIAISLASQGVKVSLAARTRSELDDTATHIRSQGGQASVHQTDMSDEDSVSRLVIDTVDPWGRLDIVVNNAGIGIFQPLEQTTIEALNQIQDVNARGTFLLCREAVAHLRRQQLSFIINIASVVAVKGYSNQAAYAASKHAMLGMSKSLAKEVQDDGIRVHVINPGGVATDMVRQARPDLNPDELIQPQDIADIVLFLVSRQGNAVIDEVNVRRAISPPWA